MRIDTININVQSPVAKAFIEALLHDMATPKADNSVQPHLAPPAIGAAWPEQGGIYAGRARGLDGAPDVHLVLATAEPDATLDWQHAMDWARGLDHEGHVNWTLPTRFESALLYAQLRDQFGLDTWYWTSTPHEKDGSFAWLQDFGYGDQSFSHESYEGRARAVRRLTA